MKSALHCARVFATLAVLAGLFLGATAICRAQTNVAEFAVPSNVTIGPYDLVCGADGSYWFTEFYVPNNSGLLGRIDAVSNTFTQFFLLTNHNAFGTAYAEPYGICRGPNGDPNLWFTEFYAGQIGRISTNGQVTEFPLPTVTSSNTTITAGPDGNLWFVEYNLSRIAAINPAPLANLTNAAGTVPLVHEYGPFGTNQTYLGGIPGTNAYLNGLASGPDGNLWFTQYTYGTIGKLNPGTGAYTLYSLPSTNAGPESIVLGADGALWFSEFISNAIGRITPSGQITEYPVPLLSGNPFPEPYAMLATPDGNLWFSEYNGSAIGRITPTGIVTIFPTLTIGSFPFSLASGPDSNIWFTEYVGGFGGVAGHNTDIKIIGRLLVSQSLSLSLPSTNLTGKNFTGILATFQNSVSNNTVTVAWGDGNYSIVGISTLPVSVTNVVVANAQTNTNTLTVSTVIPVNTNDNSNGTFSVSVNHTYSLLTNYTITVTVSDPRFDTAVGTIGVNSTNGPSMIMGEHIVNGALVLSLSGVPGRTYTVQSTPDHNPPAWTSIGTVTIPTNSHTAGYTNALSSTNRFFRLSYP